MTESKKRLFVAFVAKVYHNFAVIVKLNALTMPVSVLLTPAWVGSGRHVADNRHLKA